MVALSVVRSPTRWPSNFGRPFCFAQRRLPSRIIPIHAGTSAISAITLPENRKVTIGLAHFGKLDFHLFYPRQKRAPVEFLHQCFKHSLRALRYDLDRS